MKVTWEIGDIKSGTVMGKPGRLERWIIGYNPQRHKRCLTSLNDGTVIEFESDHAALSHINETGDLPASMLGPR